MVEIIYDGTRFQLVNGNSFTNVKVSGTLAVTGVATFTAQPIASSLTASLPVFTDASKGLVSNTMTGTGNVVMSTSPTLVTPVLDTPTSVTLTNATGLPAAGVVGTAAILGANTFTAAQEWATGSNIASAATINLNTATGNRVHITGTTTITAVTLTRGPRTVIFDGILTLTHHATNNNLPGAANITTAAGDRAIYESDGTTVYCVSYIKVSGAAVVGASGFTLGTPVSASGTLVTFTGIPAGTKQIVMTLNGVITSGASSKLIRLGDSGGIETSGYLSVGGRTIAGAPDDEQSSTGIIIYSTSSSALLYGSITFTLHNSATFTWSAAGVLSSINPSRGVMMVSGVKPLSAELTQIGLTTTNGTDTFTGGSINIAYI